MSSVPPPPPSPKKSKDSSGNNTIKNIVIGVVTTVLASSIVYFLGFQGKQADKEELKVKKEATIDAWNSLMFYEKQFRETGIRMTCNYDTTSTSADVIKEYDKIIKNINNIEKAEHVDNRLLSLIDRRIATLTDKRKATEDYLTEIEKLGPVSEEDPNSLSLYNNLISKISVIDTRDTAFISGISAELNKKYKTSFELPGVFVITPDILYGNWTVDRDKYLNLKKDNTFSFTMESKNYPGKWTLDELTIHFNFEDGSSIGYTINSGSEKFMLATDTNGNPHFFCR